MFHFKFDGILSTPPHLTEEGKRFIEEEIARYDEEERRQELKQQIGMSARYFLSLSKKEKKAFLKEQKKP